MTLPTCPACHADAPRLYPPSRRTGRLNFRCRSCGTAGWAERDDTVLDPVGLDVISVEERAKWFALKRTDVVRGRWDAVLDRLDERLGGLAGRSLYDVGAGDGHFLAVARERGMTVGGNELLAAAVEIARDEYDVSLDLGDLTRLAGAGQHDAVTMWCVLAHVPHLRETLAATFDRLTPGGVLYLQTPHLCAVDRFALGVLRLAGGRVSRWVDRRIAEHHWILFTADSLRTKLERHGFVDVQVRPKALYSLQAAPYLASLGVRGRTGRLVGRVVDRLLDRGLAPRIVLEAYARKPGRMTRTTTALEEIA